MIEEKKSHILKAVVLSIVCIFLLVLLFSKGVSPDKIPLVPQNWITGSNIIQDNYSEIVISKTNIFVLPVIGNSMSPTLSDGSQAIVSKNFTSENLQMGDIIVFNDGSELIIHRINKIANDEKGLYFVTKGDSNKLVDAYKIRQSDIRWVVIGVLY